MSELATPRFASGLSRHPVASHAIGETAGTVLEILEGEDPDLLVCFASPHFVGAFDDMMHALRDLLDPAVMVGMTAVSIVCDAHEVEEGPAFSLLAARLPDARLTPVHLRTEQTPDGEAVVGWPDLDGDPRALLLLTEPFTFPIDGFLRRLQDDLPQLAVIGGVASAAPQRDGNRLALDDLVVDHGAVGAFIDGIDVRTVVSQGCRPIGRPFTVTAADRNRIVELAGQPALERLREIAEAASDEERVLLQQGLHLGIVVDEHKTDFTRGDFLVRNVHGADPETGALVIGDLVEVGTTVQLHVRDAAAADEDLRELLSGTTADAALVFTCNGRGRRLFGVPDHDASVISEVLGRIPAAGAFCAGEIGPVGGKSFLHGFTASIALF